MDQHKASNLPFFIFTCMFLNIQGLPGKLNSLEMLALSERHDFICLSEHWLTVHEVDSYVNFSGYRMMSCYRRQHFLRGGTLIHVFNEI